MFLFFLIVGFLCFLGIVGAVILTGFGVEKRLQARAARAPFRG